MALVPFPGAHAGALQPHPDDEDDDPIAGKMSFLEHLDELRKRIVNACLSIAGGVLVSFLFINKIVNFLLAPTRKVLPPGVKMIYTEPAEPPAMSITISLIQAAGIASPPGRSQGGKFTPPGLNSKESRLAS